jgi:hypothetical protein
VNAGTFSLLSIRFIEVLTYYMLRKQCYSVLNLFYESGSDLQGKNKLEKLDWFM